MIGNDDNDDREDDYDDDKVAEDGVLDEAVSWWHLVAISTLNRISSIGNVLFYEQHRMTRHSAQLLLRRFGNSVTNQCFRPSVEFSSAVEVAPQSAITFSIWKSLDPTFLWVEVKSLAALLCQTLTICKSQYDSKKPHYLNACQCEAAVAVPEDVLSWNCSLLIINPATCC